MTFSEWHERCMYGASMLRQDARALERAIRHNASDEICGCIMQRIYDDIERAMTKRSLIRESREVNTIAPVKFKVGKIDEEKKETT